MPAGQGAIGSGNGCSGFFRLRIRCGLRGIWCFRLRRYLHLLFHSLQGQVIGDANPAAGVAAPFDTAHNRPFQDLHLITIVERCNLAIIGAGALADIHIMPAGQGAVGLFHSGIFLVRLRGCACLFPHGFQGQIIGDTHPAPRVAAPFDAAHNRLFQDLHLIAVVQGRNLGIIGAGACTDIHVMPAGQGTIGLLRSRQASDGLGFIVIAVFAVPALAALRRSGSLLHHLPGTIAMAASGGDGPGLGMVAVLTAAALAACLGAGGRTGLSPATQGMACSGNAAGLVVGTVGAIPALDTFCGTSRSGAYIPAAVAVLRDRKDLFLIMAADCTASAGNARLGVGGLLNRLPLAQAMGCHGSGTGLIVIAVSAVPALLARSDAGGSRNGLPSTAGVGTKACTAIFLVAAAAAIPQLLTGAHAGSLPPCIPLAIGVGLFVDGLHLIMIAILAHPALLTVCGTGSSLIYAPATVAMVLVAGQLAGIVIRIFQCHPAARIHTPGPAASLYDRSDLQLCSGMDIADPGKIRAGAAADAQVCCIDSCSKAVGKKLISIEQDTVVHSDPAAFSAPPQYAKQLIGLQHSDPLSGSKCRYLWVSIVGSVVNVK